MMSRLPGRGKACMTKHRVVVVDVGEGSRGL